MLYGTYVKMQTDIEKNIFLDRNFIHCTFFFFQITFNFIGTTIFVLPNIVKFRYIWAINNGLFQKFLHGGPSLRIAPT